MDTGFLACFVAVAESGSMAEAARRLNMAPSTVALRIRALEKELGFALLTRSGRVARPTIEGAAVAPRAAAILREVRDLKTLGDGAEPRGRLRLGVAQTAIATVLCDVLPVIAQRYPQLEIVVQKGSSSQVYSMFEDGRVDAAFLFHPPFALPKSFVWRPLRTERFIVIASAAETEADPLRLLRDRPFIRYDRSLWSGQIADNYLREVRIRPEERVELDTLDAIAILVDRGIGVSLVPDRALPLPEGLSIRGYALPDPAPVRTLGLAWAIGSVQTRLVRVIEHEALEAGMQLPREAKWRNHGATL